VLFLLWLLPASAQEPSAKDPAAIGKGPLAAQKPLDRNGQLRVSEPDRCPVCAMFPAKRPQTATALVLADGRTFYFCGNGCLLRAWHGAPVYLNVPQESIQRMVTRDYFSAEPLDAQKAWWVAGSDVVGPMGPAIVALPDEQAVARFKQDHGGSTVFQLAQITPQLWARIFPAK
jgi:hypothetical protein